MASTMPLAVISEASWPTQKITTGTLADADALVAGLVGQPALIVVGEVVRHASFPALLPELAAGAGPAPYPVSKPALISRLSTAWQRHWSEIMSADAAADASLEPELPASVFVQASPGESGQAQAADAASAARQRSARISTSKG